MGFPIPQTGTVTEDQVDVNGNLSVSGDADFFVLFLGQVEGNWVPQTLTGAYGSTLVIDAQGNWTYTADNSDPTIQALNAGQTLTEVFTITGAGGIDGTGSTTVTITIQGADEPPCFVAGTQIATPAGPRPIEDLRKGDLVLTSDLGPQPILWIGARRISAAEFDDFEQVRPVRIRAGAFGPGVPEVDLVLSPAHRVALSGPRTQLYLGQSEVLCAAHHLINGANVFREACTEVEYFHILLPAHALVMANGAPAESFLPGPLGLAGFRDEAREEVLKIFPELRGMGTGYGPPARQIARRHEAALLAPQSAAPDFLRRTA